MLLLPLCGATPPAAETAAGAAAVGEAIEIAALLLLPLQLVVLLLLLVAASWGSVCSAGERCWCKAVQAHLPLPTIRKLTPEMGQREEIRMRAFTPGAEMLNNYTN